MEKDSDTLSIVSTTTAASSNNPVNYYSKNKQNGDDRLAKAMAKARARRAQQEIEQQSWLKVIPFT